MTSTVLVKVPPATLASKHSQTNRQKNSGPKTYCHRDFLISAFSPGDPMSILITLSQGPLQPPFSNMLEIYCRIGG